MSASLIRVSALVLLAASLGGCATPTKMAWTSDSKTAVKPADAVLLMTATVRNSYHPSFQPRLIAVDVEKGAAASRQERLNFTPDDKARFKEADSHEEGNTYLIRMELAPGQYVIRGLALDSPHFPILGAYFAPLHETFTVSAPGVYYLGHVQATVRERSGDEFKAGPSIPLLDQAVAGASGGTFDVEVGDHWDSDENSFRGAFPQLGDQPVHKAILGPFDRAYAQKWWAEH